jgi:hypothetical protein
MSRNQFGLFVVLGVAFWLSAALFVRFTGASVFGEGSALLPVLYAFSFVFVFAFLFVARLVSGVGLREMLLPAVVMTSTALLLDGIAVAWFSGLYGDDPGVVMRGAAWILWGAGLGQFIALALQQRAPAATSRPVRDALPGK